jgi:hypothetical protein
MGPTPGLLPRQALNGKAARGQGAAPGLPCTDSGKLSVACQQAVDMARLSTLDIGSSTI